MRSWEPEAGEKDIHPLANAPRGSRMVSKQPASELGWPARADAGGRDRGALFGLTPGAVRRPVSTLVHGSNSSTADFFRVRVVGTTTSTVFERLGAAPDVDASWATASASLNAFAGQTVPHFHRSGGRFDGEPGRGSRG